jgi:hypothetical protein
LVFSAPSALYPYVSTTPFRVTLVTRFSASYVIELVPGAGTRSLGQPQVSFYRDATIQSGWSP